MCARHGKPPFGDQGRTGGEHPLECRSLAEGRAHVLRDDLAGLWKTTALPACRSSHEDPDYSAFRRLALVLLVRIELTTSPLPRPLMWGVFSRIVKCLTPPDHATARFGHAMIADLASL